MKLKRITRWLGLSLMGLACALLVAGFATSGPGGSPFNNYIARALVGLVDQVSTVLCTEGQACVIRSSPYGAIYTTPIDLSGNVIGAGGGGGSTVAISQTTTDNDVDANVTALPNEGQQTMANSISTTIASNQSPIPVTQSGTWTLQPGNTANTTPWLVRPHDGTDAQDITAAGEAEVTLTTALPAGTNNIGDVDLGSPLPAGTNSIGFVSAFCDFPELNITLNWTSAQTGPTVLQAVAGGSTLVICQYSVQCSADATSNTDILLAWDDTADVTIIDRDGVPPGGGWLGPRAQLAGGDGQDLLLTAEAVTAGTCTFHATAYTP